MTCFQVHPVAEDNSLAERQPRLRAVPVHEFVDGMTIAALGVRAGEAVENRGLRDFKVREWQDRFYGASVFLSRLAFPPFPLAPKPQGHPSTNPGPVAPGS